jgi:hypothetical protein
MCKFGNGTANRYRGIIGALCLACVVAIVILSLIPGAYRPHTGASKLAEHFIAYAGTAVGFSLISNTIRQRLVVLATLSALSGVMDFLQQYVPGRAPAILDVIASAAGAVTGLVVGSIAYLAALTASGTPNLKGEGATTPLWTKQRN